MSIVELEQVKLSYLALGDILKKPTLVFCHGIMGNKKNLENFVKKLLQDLKEHSALIFDLRNHGDSSKNCPPFTVQACAQDIVAVLNSWQLIPKAVFGHSFGGKAALLIANELPLKQVWLLDTPPGAVKQTPLPTNSLSVFQIIDKLRQIKWPKASRNDLVKDLISIDVPREIALWMTTNLRPLPEGLYLNFDLEDIEKMLLDFIALDLWPMVASVNEKTRVHIVAAEHGERFMAADKLRFLNIKNTEGQFHLLKGSGHFVHADNPPGLIQIILKNLEA